MAPRKNKQDKALEETQSNPVQMCTDLSQWPEAECMGVLAMGVCTSVCEHTGTCGDSGGSGQGQG